MSALTEREATAFRLTSLCAAVSALCATYGASVTSWWRTERRNAHVGGCKHSKHLCGEAVDIVYDDEPPAFEPLTKSLADVGVHLIRERTHDHLETRAD